MGASRKRLAAAPAEVAWHAHIPRRDVVIGCAGLAALLAVIPGWSEHSLSVKWKLAHSSRGGLGSARWPRTVARPAFVGSDRVALPWHADRDGAEAPSGVKLYERRAGKPALAPLAERALGGAPLLALAAGVVRGETVVVVVDAAGACACLDGATLRELWSTQLDAAWFDDAPLPPSVGVALEPEAVVVAVHGSDGRARLARLAAGRRGAPAWAVAFAPAPDGDRGASPPRSSWEADADFWRVAGEQAYRAPGGDALEALAAAHLPFYWGGAEDTAVGLSPSNASLYVSRGPFGLDFWDAATGAHAARAPLPARALVDDVDGDGAADSIACVDFDSSPPRHRKSETSDVAACAAVGVRGLAPVERFFEASLCHDRGVERDSAKRRQDRSRSRWKQRRVHSAPPLKLEGRDMVFAVSRGVLTRVDAAGDYRWQTRHGPTWADHRKGGYLAPLSRRELILVGSDAVAVYDLEHGGPLARLELPVTWDDEQVQQRPVLDGDEQLLLVVTQFHTFGVELKRKFSVGAATTKLAVGVLVAIAVFFVFLAAGAV